MANNNNISINITGDSSGLQRAIRQSEQSLSNFGREAEGFAGDFASSLAGGIGKAGTALTGMAGAAAVAGLSIAATFAKIQESSEKAFEVFQSASLSQMGIQQIQQMANMYVSVGLTMENVADQQKDIKDRIGDALTNMAGSMLTDVIQPLKLNVLELQKMADAGQDVYAKIYFAAKAQGLSTSQMVNMFETMGNDATKRLTVLQQFNTEQEYNNALTSQQVQLTDEQSEAYERYRTASRDLSNAWEKWNNSVLAPIAGNLAEILDLMTKIINSKPVAAAATATGQQGINAVKQTQGSFQNDLLRNSSIYGQQLADQHDKQNESLNKNLQNRIKLAQGTLDVIKEGIDKYNQGVDKSTITAAMKPFQTAKEQTQAKIDALDVQYKQTKASIEESVYRAYGGDQKAMQADISKLTKSYKDSRETLVKQLTADDDKAAEAAKRKAEAESRKADTLAKKTAAERIKAQSDLNKIISDMTIDSNGRQLAEFDRQQNALIDSINKTAKTLGLSQGQLGTLLNQQQASYTAKRTDMVNSMIGYQDSNKHLKDTNSLLQNGNLNGNQKNFLADQQAQRINGDNPFSYDNTDQLLKQNQEAMNLELQQNDLLLKGHEDYEKRKAEITAKYNAQAMTISNQNAQAQLSVFSATADSLADGMVAAFGKSSGAAQVAMAAQKGISMAMIGMNLATALSSALATPFPASLAAYGQVLSLGMNLITTAKGATSGQFHGGVDELPSSYDNKSFVLKAGERVVQPEANKKLTKFLDNQDKNGGSSGDITINAPLIINSDTSGDDKKFNEMLKKHQNSVVQAVRSSQKRNT